MVTLIPCKLREGYIVPIKEAELIKVEYMPFLKRFSAADNRYMVLLAKVKTGSFVGKLQDGGSFIVNDVRRQGDIRQTLKKDPLFASRIKELYRIEGIDRPSKVINGAESALKEG